MRTTRWALTMGALLLTPVLLVGCPAVRGGGRGSTGGSASGSGQVRSSGGGGLSASCRGDFGTTAAAQKIEMFLRATAEFGDAAYQIESDLLSACQRMGRAMGISAAELSGSGAEGVGNVCRAVDAKLRAEMQAIGSSANAPTMTVEIRPPHCEVSVNAYAQCAAECEANIDPGSVQITCEGGELRGRCSAQCTGSCAVDVAGRCGGTCEGMCDGTCSQTNADGSCAGTCDGTCRGECVVRASGSCQGECRGGCSVEFQEPYCTGEVRPASVSARCRASCDARVEASARCEPGEARMTVSGGGLDAAGRARVEGVQNAIREGLGTILTIRKRLERLQRSGQQIARIAPELPNAAAPVGIGAVACATSAAGAIANSMASVSVSLEVSVSISASASASASTR